jgi:hypothetical protein
MMSFENLNIIRWQGNYCSSSRLIQVGSGDLVNVLGEWASSATLQFAAQ